MIEDEMSLNKSQKNVSFTNESSNQNDQRAFISLIEKSTVLHMEFWAQMSEDIPDLGKLSDLGGRIFATNQEIEENWIRLNQIGGNSVNKSLRTYGKFMIEVLGQKQEGDELLNKFINFSSNGIFSSNESTASIFLSTEAVKKKYLNFYNIIFKG